jgi:hypothetical protein
MRMIVRIRPIHVSTVRKTQPADCHNRSTVNATAAYKNARIRLLTRKVGSVMLHMARTTSATTPSAAGPFHGEASAVRNDRVEALEP